MGFPEGFATRIQDVHGEVGKAWLERLPDLIQYIEQAWSIHLSNPFPGLNYN